MRKIKDFKKLSLEDKGLLDGYLNESNIESYEYLFTSLYLWRKLNSVSYAVIDDTLVIDKTEEGKGYFFAQPVGYKKEGLKSIVDILVAKSRGLSDRTYLFGDVDEGFIEDLRNYTDLSFEAIEDVNDFEYVYNTADLMELKGKKYHGQKNHFNTFEKTYDYDIREINDDGTIRDCMELLHRWHEEVAVTMDKEMCMETDAIHDIFEEIKYLNLHTIALYVGNELAGFSIGEKIRDTAVIHVERADIAFKGVYAFINRTFVSHCFADTLFVNRQEDCGNEGLRRAKQSYHPTKMVKKYLIKIN